MFGARQSETMELEENNNRNRRPVEFLIKKAYSPPSWASHLNHIPSHYFSLAHLPTPIHLWNLPNLPDGTELWLKRDDLSGLQLSGNKARKLEFLMADAVANGADSVITIGGIQSNHCRATAVAAKYLNLDCCCKFSVDQIRIGRPSLGIPSRGYIEAIKEIEQQVLASNERLKFDDIVVACGSGGTVAGLSLGSWLGTLKAKVHAFSIYDEPDYFYNFVQELLDGFGAGVNSHEIVNIQDAKGLGYAKNTSDELKFVQEVATATGIILDPVYSGKAAYGMMKDMAENPRKKWEGRKILFIHTGGFLGLYDKVNQMSSLVEHCVRMHIDESV
ncbi:putative D-cysteine desulfhydrase 1, mitochondrial [Jatropha curcas]|uniref:putative D-cysteine desulfhydrase 1, mitochondrial n=1 Tax=Jatropha curcas TaxID=180498 RepID=UPI001894BA4A|nr:putative D-cysteine desulfhydrase 1, mitochondrial [Jatropha curcas]